jgi:hypothetical protein
MARKKRSPFYFLGLLAALALLLVVVNQGWFRRHNNVRVSNGKTPPEVTLVPASYKGTAAPVPVSAIAPDTAPFVRASFRPLNFALLRGGFTSTDEFLDRANSDPVLHSFYGDCAERNAGMHPLSEDVMVFTTFRRNNQIKWARKPLLVRKGEYVMTYCGKTILARCGNLVSVSPMEPSEDVPPALLETPVDRVEPPVTYAATAEAATADAVPAPAPAVASAVPVPHKFFFFIPPFYIPSGGSHTIVVPTSVVPTTIIPPVVPPILTPPPVAPPPPTRVTGDEFSSGHQAFFTLLLGLFVIGLVKLVIR